MDREAIEEAIEVLEDASAEMLTETGNENYYGEAITALRKALVDADDTSQKHVDEMVKTEHDKQIEIAQAYEQGWNAALAQREWIPEALRLADALDHEFVQGRISNHTGRKAAVELRRLALKQWVSLTDDEINILSCEMVKGDKSVNWLCKVLEAKLKEKNGG
jgi:hypothetical protein